jgi:hypothetical protein
MAAYGENLMATHIWTGAGTSGFSDQRSNCDILAAG